MARTYRRDFSKGKIKDGEYNSCFYSKEEKDFRVRQARKVRHVTKQLLHEEDFDDLPVHIKTSGWETH